MTETMTKSYFELRRAELETAYNNIKPDWQELADFFMPRSVRFIASDVNKKPAKNKKIKDSAPLKSRPQFFIRYDVRCYKPCNELVPPENKK